MIYRRRRSRNAFTLIEVLVATAVTLLMMISLAKIFKIIGDSMQEGRATLELNNRLRNVALRVQTDLANLALDDEGGYLEYFDGAQTDATTGLAFPALNRFGDVDDIVMFTSKAEDVWFTGKVPLYVLRGGIGPSGPAADDFDMVTVASEYAEIAIFAQPVVANTAGNPTFDPAPLVASPAAFLDVDANGVPDDYRLHYRVMLIRPDLNVGGLLPTASHPGVGEPWLTANPVVGVLPGGTTSFSLPTPLCDMARAHSQCDLSMRRVRALPAVDGLPAAADFVAANDLQSLQNPTNRFAHVEIPLPGGLGRTMPLLALGPQIGLDFDGDSTNDLAEPSGTLGGPSFLVGSGFLHPAYTMHSAWDAADPTSGLPFHQISASRVGEDILAANIRAFDVKGFDPGAPVVASLGNFPVGGGNLPGVPGVDDDGNGTVDDALEIGWDGSDDEILGPADPGYASAIFRLSAGPGTPAAPVEASLVSFGAYVDLGWARKVLTTLPAYGLTPAMFSSTPNLWSPFSGYDARSWAGGPPFTDEMYRSGKVIQAWPGSGAPPFVLQFTADTSDYMWLESNNTLQAQLSGLLGVVHVLTTSDPLFLDASVGSAWLQDNWRFVGGFIDAATDGLDNDGIGFADDRVEKESSPPFVQKLRGIRLSIRMEDPATRILKQMSIGKDLPVD